MKAAIALVLLGIEFGTSLWNTDLLYNLLDIECKDCFLCNN